MTWYEQHKEQAKAAQSSYYVRNREKILDRQRLYHAKNKLTRKDKDLQRKYGISLKIKTAMLAAQSGKCSICGTDNWAGRHNEPSVDHDHETGRVRGLLCYNCNNRVGWLETRRSAIEDYLSSDLDWREIG